jgi:cell fate (sporulation/competence/biofilm development) regulator YlbF (YheA/YmcA/DUF963 family)
MLRTEIQEAAVEFGRAVRQAPAVSAYHAAAAALAADTATQALLDALRDAQSAYARVQATGAAPAAALGERLRACQAAVRANATIMAHLRATNDVKSFLPEVAGQVSATLGTDFAGLIARSSC